MWGEYFIDMLAHKVGKMPIYAILAMFNLQIKVINV